MNKMFSILTLSTDFIIKFSLIKELNDHYMLD